MANSHTQGTGILVLDKVTPVITALFTPFNLDPRIQEDNGGVYIGYCGSEDYASWSDVTADFIDICRVSDSTISENLPLPEALLALAKHLKIESSRLKEIESFIEQVDLDDQITLDQAFALAKILDDGHGLKKLIFENAVYCDRPRLFAFGGYGTYYSENVSLVSTSQDCISLGRGLDANLTHGDLEGAASILVEDFRAILDGIQDDQYRVKLYQLVADALSLGSVDDDASSE